MKVIYATVEQNEVVNVWTLGEMVLATLERVVERELAKGEEPADA